MCELERPPLNILKANVAVRRRQANGLWQTLQGGVNPAMDSVVEEEPEKKEGKEMEVLGASNVGQEEERTLFIAYFILIDVIVFGLSLPLMLG